MPSNGGLTKARIDWYEIDRQVTNEILKDGLARTIKNLDSSKAKAEGPEQLVKRFAVYRRAGDSKKVIQTIQKLSKQQEECKKPVLGAMAGVLIDSEQWELARQYLEIFPQAEPGWGYVLIR
ncbi:MAG: hypothetical protein K8F91_17810, partial [Candidatus Obscuribacterales bacterium]|nr:hypothetical protein [Candidatus Obscuribacterales bacterium]